MLLKSALVLLILALSHWYAYSLGRSRGIAAAHHVVINEARVASDSATWDSLSRTMDGIEKLF